jgi:4-amino-4-deoxy-L-arabinose transferase-like glycosyltransferase
MSREGNRILEARGTYGRNLALARAGTLPFFVIACVVVWLWARRLFGPAPAVASVALFSLLPPVLAHSGLATTDMALAATLPAAFLAFTSWLEGPTSRQSIVLGVCLGLALLSKMSAVAFIPLGFLGVIACRWFFERFGIASDRPSQPTPVIPTGWRNLVLVAGFLCLTIWAGYRFSLVRPAPLHGIPVPAFEFFKGVYQVQQHNAEGHPAYLLGELSSKGWWYFFPVTLAVKTPLAFLLLAGLGLFLLARSFRGRSDWPYWVPAVGAAAILAVAMMGNIDIGVRHVLPVYTFVALYAGHAVVWAWNRPEKRGWFRAALGGLGLWLIGSTTRIHPDYLAYFNELAGDHPERILVNTDLCWGQDYFRLIDTLRARGIDSVWVAYHGSIDEERHQLPGMHDLPLNQRVTGWVAASARELKGVKYHGHEWIGAYPPVTRIGYSIWLFYVPPDSAGGATPLSRPPGAPGSTPDSSH